MLADSVEPLHYLAIMFSSPLAPSIRLHSETQERHDGEIKTCFISKQGDRGSGVLVAGYRSQAGLPGGNSRIRAGTGRVKTEQSGKEQSAGMSDINKHIRQSGKESIRVWSLSSRAV